MENIRREEEEKEGRQEYCRRCGKGVSSDEIAMTKKLINRGTQTSYCIY